ncbi:type III restriction endonuclease subunit R [Deltaproteobacteria bacterium Smac51]|nr:type III restriction endonuclease subunit R [Deltaproteobacteria bacterium Smac51]
MVHLKNISQRLSLRPPQSESLALLAEIAGLLPLVKNSDLSDDLAKIKERFPSFVDFEREFPSFCFALATGVGKTRLMGAFIAWLYQAKGFRNFLVVAPNLTIYNKLISDFNPNARKYVFDGLPDFSVTPPEIITGDNYEDGRGARGTSLFEAGLHINIFNISKLNSEVRGGKSPRIKRLAEVLGQSYFDYLAGLPDLVLLMDEAHRYRATAGLRALNDLKPVLGLELTATPQVESGSRAPIPFQNVIYSYPLSKALEDGYIKEPAVATRENFDARLYDENQLERLKLEDAVRIHETVKTELTIYAANRDLPPVKPFMLIVAADTSHAENLLNIISGDDFFQSRYAGRVITVHSSKSGEEKDDAVERLLDVENPKEPTEIVIHVNMLKEGWDVTNLYTIVPLRAANSRTLVEQSIGRGLRLPYGKRTGVAAVDRLTIVAHDRFDEIIREANAGQSIIKTGLVIGRDLDPNPQKPLLIAPTLETVLGQSPPPLPEGSGETTYESKAAPAAQSALFQDSDRETVRLTLETLRDFERLPTSRKLAEPEIQAEIVRQVEGKVTPAQGILGDMIEKPKVAEVVQKVTEAFLQYTIDIPRIVLTRTQGDDYNFISFTLDTVGVGRLSPVEQDILIQHLRTNERETLESGGVYQTEERPEDYLVSALMDFDGINYEQHGDLLYDLAKQMVTYLHSYLNHDNEVLNVLQYHQKPLSGIIHSQMLKHLAPAKREFRVSVTKGFQTPKINGVSYNENEPLRNYRHELAHKNVIRGCLFTGFKKCIYPAQKFHSDTERWFAILLEDEPRILKWYKPGREDFRIYYDALHTYEPDFVVEMDDRKLLCEIKMEKDLESEEVQTKAAAARRWCQAATEHEVAHGGKPWSYILIPHNEIKPSATIDWLINRFAAC